MAVARQKRLSKREKRRLKQEGILTDNNQLSSKFQMKFIQPATRNQEIAFESWDEGYHLMLHGIAGTGKTFLATYFALSEAMKNGTPAEKVYIVRSTVPTRDQGFLPGSQRQKEAIYEEVYREIASELFGRGDAYDILKQKATVEFRSTSFLRGVTFRDCVVVVDEVQNMSDGELHTVMTRIGENSRIIFAGDVKQDDLTSERKKEVSGLRDFMRIISNMREFDFIEFVADDIVRSALVKSYIIERDKLGL
jgi:phosphate starvation-inducible protein PhoH